MAVFDCLWY